MFKVGDKVEHFDELASGTVTKVQHTKWYLHEEDGLQKEIFDETAKEVMVQTYDVKWSDGKVSTDILEDELIKE